MLDTNVFDRLDADSEAAFELENRRDLRLFVSEVQLAELAALPDEVRRPRYLELARRLCVTVSASPSSAAAASEREPKREPKRPAASKHGSDRLIAAAARAHCDLLVTDDAGLLAYARDAGVRAMDWAAFVSRVVFGR